MNRTPPELTRLHERLDHALTDLRDLDVQVRAGEIEQARADQLRSRYEADAATALAAIDAFEPPTRPPRSRRRAIVGVAGFAAAGVAIALTLASAVEPRRDGGFITGGPVADSDAAPVDLSTVGNDELEAVVAANPDVVPMRLALARRYVEAGEFSSALGHYMYVLERESHPEALMYLGWMTYLSGDATTGVSLLEQSLAIGPEDPLAQWFLANALHHGAGRADEAVPLLQAVIDSGVAPPEIVEAATAMLAEASR